MIRAITSRLRAHRAARLEDAAIRHEAGVLAREAQEYLTRPRPYNWQEDGL